MSADTLTTTSRNFYEHTKSKMAVSLFLSSMAMMALGFSAAFGGQADNANWTRKNSSGDAEKAAQSLVGGYGFACFSFICAFFIFLGAAFYISPLISGSAVEKKMLSKPDELEGSGAQAHFTPSNHGSEDRIGGSGHGSNHGRAKDQV